MTEGRCAPDLHGTVPIRPDCCIWESCVSVVPTLTASIVRLQANHHLHDLRQLTDFAAAFQKREGFPRHIRIGDALLSKEKPKLPLRWSGSSE